MEFGVAFLRLHLELENQHITGKVEEWEKFKEKAR